MWILRGFPDDEQGCQCRNQAARWLLGSWHCLLFLGGQVAPGETGPITSWQIDGETVTDFIFLVSKSLQMVTAAMKLKVAYSILKSRHHFANNGPCSQSYGFSSSHVWM